MGLFIKFTQTIAEEVSKKTAKKITEEQKQLSLVKQAKALLKYTTNNFEQFCNIVQNLEQETKDLIEQISSLQNQSLSFNEKRNLKKLKNQAKENLQYLYLSTSYFIYLSKVVNDVSLKNNEYTFIIKFSPFFDGKKVLEIYENEDYDDSVLGQLKQIGKEFTETFISSTPHFDLETFLYDYEEKIHDLIIPNIQAEMERFENSVFPAQKRATPPMPTEEEINCPTCQRKLGKNEKFCPECGTKIEPPKFKFCCQCGTKLPDDVKFCSECGNKC